MSDLIHFTNNNKIMKKDKTVHHPSNAKNCPKCMDLWIERENKLAKPKKDYGTLLVNALKRMK